mgnify:CR=1 FL=1
MCENKDKKLNISCFTACFEQKGKHLNLWASAFKPPGKSFLHAGQPFRRNRRNIAIGKSERVNNLSTRSLKASQRQIINFKKRYTTMKRQPLSMLALASLLILSSCGQTAGVKTAGAQQATGEIIASSETAVAQTESGKVGGFLQDGIYIYKGIPYAKAERFMPPQPADKWEGVRSSRMFGPTCPQAVRMGWGADEHAFAFHWDDGYPGEDCLRVNIWTPGLNDGKKRPVMVWLHGGGYAAGSGQELPSYDGFNLAKKGDAVVGTSQRPRLPRPFRLRRQIRQIRQCRPARPRGSTSMGKQEYSRVWRRRTERNDFRTVGRRRKGFHIACHSICKRALPQGHRSERLHASHDGCQVFTSHRRCRDGRVGIESLADRRAAEDALRTAAFCR